MKLSKIGEAGRCNPKGAVEKSDILVKAEPNEGQGIQVQLSGKSVVLKQFGRQIEAMLKQAAEDAGVEDVTIVAKDNGALDYTIKARVRAAIARALK
ncbi:MAG: citrate lyase acyl carrier protein [Desulfovibrionaceae bacterium]|nr:citrate lyase acyl carrier protein [Desulfovibrionaceae bacterium]